MSILSDRINQEQNPRQPVPVQSNQPALEYRPPTVDPAMNNELVIINAVLGRQLGQSRPANTTAVSIYAPRTGTVVEITAIIICNTSGADQTFQIFHDEDGTTYDQTTALYYDTIIAADTTVLIEFKAGLYMANTSGNLAVRTSNNSALTFTVYGRIYAR